MGAIVSNEYSDEPEADAAYIPLWTPFPDSPQVDAINSEADFLFYGGGAGGGKSDLLLGYAIEEAQKSIIFRREFPQLTEIMERAREIVPPEFGSYNEVKKIWRILNRKRRFLEFGAMEHETSKLKYQGRPHDFIGFDEMPQFTKTQVQFVSVWNRSKHAGQRVRRIGTGNPPTEQEGYWIIEVFKSWLDSQYSYPALPGELRYFFEDADGIEQELEDGSPFRHKGQIMTPESRTFIPAKVEDNPVYMRAGYKDTLMRLPEPLRSLMLDGDFTVGNQDNPYQVIPSQWIRIAQARWLGLHNEGRGPDVLLTCIGCDIAHGGGDRTVLCGRYGNWFAPIETYPGKETEDGDAAAELIITMLEKGGSVGIAHIDAIGYGASCADAMKRLKRERKFSGKFAAINFAAKAVKIGIGGKQEYHTDRSKKFKFRNLRAFAYWTLREALDPANGQELAIPPDRELFAELCAARYELTTQGIQIEDKADIKARLGHSPDKADAMALAIMPTPQGERLLYTPSTGSVKTPIPKGW